MSDEPVRLERQLLTAREVAELLRLPVSTVYELARTERLPHLRIGRAMRFSREDLETYLADVCRSAPRRARLTPSGRPSACQFHRKWYPRVVPGPSLGAKTPHEAKKKPWDYQGFHEERLKGLEPSTFCMANGTASGLVSTSYLQIDGISVLTTA
jgi:excisionase family DNA binding protein